MKRKLKQITAALLCVAMLCGLLPMGALAAEGEAAVRTAGGYTYTRVTDESAIKADGKYLLVLVKNENETFFMKPERREKGGRTGFALERVSCNGRDALMGAYQPYEWTFKKEDSGWLLGYGASYVKFERENDDAKSTVLRTQGSTLQITAEGDGHTFSGDGSYFNLDAGLKMVSGWKDSPSKFYIYERAGAVDITTTPHNAAPDAAGCTLGGCAPETGDWTNGAYNSDLIYLKDNSAKVNVTFTGSGIRLYGKSSADAGIAKITVDSTEVVHYDQYSGVDRHRSLMLDKTWSASGEHTITVEYTGNKNESSSGSYVAVDFFEILESVSAEPEEPYLPTDPENPTQFMDCILPAPVVGTLSDTCWGAAHTGPRDQENGLEDKGTGTDGQHYCYWDGGILKDDVTGVYYMFASRWDEETTHEGWPHSVGVYATSNNLYGPYVDQGLLWPDVADGAGHNVFPLKLKEGGEQVGEQDGGINAKYAIVLGDTSTNWLKGAIFVSESLAGPWKNIGQMQFTEDGEFGLSNICIVLTPEGKYLAYNRNGDIARADSIGGPWTVLRNRLWDQIPSLSGHTDVEDPVVWYSGGLYHCVVNRWDAKMAYYLTSEDGVHEWREHPGMAYEPGAPLFRYPTGEVNKWTKIERPNVYVEDGKVKAMTFSVIDVEKEVELGGDSHGSKVVVAPFSNEGLKKLADCPNEIFDREGIPVSEDAHVQSWQRESGAKHGDWNYLCLKNNADRGLFGQEANPNSDSSNGDDCKIGYLKFDLSEYQGQTVTHAELSLVFQKKFDGSGMEKIRVAAVDGAWDEAELTWGSKPVIAGNAQIVESPEFSLEEKNKVVTVDVTALVQQALTDRKSELTLALSETAGAQISIASKEYGKGYEPMLNITAGAQLPPAETPTAVFDAATMKLTDVEAGVKYRVNGGAWTEISDTPVDLSAAKLTAGTIELYRPGDSVSTGNSAIQTITLTKAAAPKGLVAAHETAQGAKDGSITGTADGMEYKAESGSWEKVTGGTVSGLAPGKYQVRVKGAGTVLASDSAYVRINAYGTAASENVYQKVLVIGLDGAGAYAKGMDNVPNIKALFGSGAGILTYSAQAMEPTISGQNWASMFTGSAPGEHGMTNDTPAFPNIPYSSYFKAAREAYPAANLASFASWDVCNNLYDADADVYAPDMGGNDAAVVADAVAYLNAHVSEDKHMVAFVHLDTLDHIGHESGYGPGNDAYTAGFATVDGYVKTLVDAVLEGGSIRDDTVVLLTADHGGDGQNHGGATPGEKNVMFGVAGKTFRDGRWTLGSMENRDVAPLVASLLDAAADPDWTGKNPLVKAVNGAGQTVLNVGDGDLVFSAGGVTQNGQAIAADTEGYELTGVSTAGNVVSVTGGTHLITLNNVSMQKETSPFILSSGTNVTLTLKGDNQLKATGTSDAGEAAALRVSAGAFLTIEGTPDDTLTAAAGARAAGIGGNKSETAGTITINGGKITAIGGGQYGYGAGIGGGECAGVEQVTINGGYVTATGGKGGYSGWGAGAGIGTGGDEGEATANITVNGGTVVATGGISTSGPDSTAKQGAGLGDGRSDAGEWTAQTANVTINGGAVYVSYQAPTTTYKNSQDAVVFKTVLPYGKANTECTVGMNGTSFSGCTNADGDLFLYLPNEDEARTVIVTDSKGGSKSFEVKNNALVPVMETYYVDSATGSDQDDGLTPETAWKTLAKVNEQTFGPGDKLLLKRGCVWVGETLILRGSGSAEKPIIVNSYGDDGQETAIVTYENEIRQTAEADETQKPWIKANHEYEQAVLIENVEYWEVNNLQVSNDDPQNPGRTDVTEKRYGMVVSVDNFVGETMDGITVRNCYIHDCNGNLQKLDAVEGNALYVRQVSTEAFPSKLNNLLLEGNHVRRVNRNGISFTASGSVRSTNVNIRHNLLEDIGGDGIKTWGLYGGMVEYNKLDGGMERARDKSAGIWPWDCDNTTFQYNEVCNMKSTHDGQAFDIDYLTTNTIFQYNYSHDNEGGFMLLCAPDSSYSTGNVVRYNLSVNDGSSGTQDDRDERRGSVLQIAGNTDTYIYNNTFYLGPDQADYPVVMVGDWGQSRNQYFYNNVFCIDTPNLSNFFELQNVDIGQRNYTFSNNVVTGAGASAYADEMRGAGLQIVAADSDEVFADPASLTPAGFAPASGSPILSRGTPMTMVKDGMFDGSYHESDNDLTPVDRGYPFINLNAGHDYLDVPLKQGTPDLGAIQDANARAVHIATYVGEVPTLDGVTWSGVTANTFRTPYETVTIRGTDADGSTVTAKVEVVPQDTVYFLDLGKSGGSDAHSAVRALVGDGLRNAVPDQAFTEGGWGHTASAYDSYWAYTAADADKHDSGVYADNHAGGYIIYKLPLKAGQYTVTSYHKDWWQNGGRPMDVEAKIIKSDGNALPAWRCRSGMEAGDGAAVTYAFTMPEDGTLEYTVRSTADQAAVISWLAVQKGGAAFDAQTSFSGVADSVWLDTEGYPIQAHGGEVRQFTVGGVTKYYLIGEDRSVRGWPTDGVRVYSSTDLLNWKNEGLVLRTMTSKDQFADGGYFEGLYGDLTPEQQDALYVDLSQAAVIERPKMLYNEKTGKYVLWFHADGPTEGNSDSYAKASVGVAVADSPAGPFRLVNVQRMNHVEGYYDLSKGMARDMTVFQDNADVDKNGVKDAYVIYSSEENKHMYVSLLNADYTGPATEGNVDTMTLEDGTTIKTFAARVLAGEENREAPAMFKYDGRYYMITSGCTGWTPNEAQYAVADSPFGPWSSWGNPCVGDEADKTFRTQSTAVIPVDPENGLFIYMGDRWRDSALNTSGYVWLPIELKQDGGIQITPCSDWTMDDLEALAPVKTQPITVYQGEALPATVDVTLLGQTHSGTPVVWDDFTTDKISPFLVSGTLTALDSRRVQFRVNVIPENALYFVDSGADGMTEYFTAVAEGNVATLKNTEAVDQPYENAATWGYEGSNSGTDGSGAENAYQSIRYVHKGSGTPLGYSFALDAGSYQVSVGHYDPWSEWAKGNRVANISVLGGEAVLAEANDIAITGDYQLTTLDEVTLAEDGTLQVRISPKNTGENSDIMVSFIVITRTQDVPPTEHTHTLIRHEAVAATCTEDGTIEYWQCSDTSCAKLFADEQGEREIQSADLVEERLPHTFDSEIWVGGKTGHWHVCTLCNTEKTEAEAHISGGEATEETAELCTVCGYEINPPLSHEHTFDAAWTYDETDHWHVCTGCDAEEEGSRANHIWELNSETSTEAEQHYTCLCGKEKTVVVEPPEELDKTPIDAAIVKAEAAKSGVSISDADPSQVSSGTRFVSTQVMAALDEAMKTARAALVTVTTAEEVAAAALALETAIAAFEPAIQNGTYVPPYTPPSGGGGSSNTTTETEKNEDGSTTKTVTNKKTGEVTETTTYPDGTKRVVEKKADGSMTATETRKDGTKVASATTSGGETTAGVTVPGDKKVTVTIPTAEKPAPGVVAVIEYADGTREVVSSSVATEDGLRLTLGRDASLKLVDNTKRFSDVKDGDWSAEAVAFVSSRALFHGVGGGQFAPEAAVTRGMFLTVLARYDGSEETPGETWYSAAQTWAVETGLSDGSRMEDVITREQLVTLLYRYAGMPQPPEEARLAAFADGGEVADYAVKAMEWAVSAGLLNGKSGSQLAPGGTASRAEVAAILQRFITEAK